MRYLLFTFLLLSLMSSSSALAQCEISNRVTPDGSMYYFVKPLQFYSTADRQLKGGVVTDNENYFILLSPLPFPPKPDGSNLKSDIQMKLANHQVYTLKHFDSRYAQSDTLFEMIYLIDKKYLDDFQHNDVDEVTMNMGKAEPARVYEFKLHKAAIREQLSCLKNRER